MPHGPYTPLYILSKLLPHGLYTPLLILSKLLAPVCTPPLLILYKLLALIRTAMNRYRVVVEIHRPSPTASYWPGAYSL